MTKIWLRQLTDVLVNVHVNNIQAKKVDRAVLAEEKGYWQGEWICADCGYIYDPDIFPGKPFFEEQTKGFKCKSSVVALGSIGR